MYMTECNVNDDHVYDVQILLVTYNSKITFKEQKCKGASDIKRGTRCTNGSFEVQQV